MKQPRTSPQSGSPELAQPGGPEPATATETREHLVQRSGRAFVPIPNVFVQDPNTELKNRQAPLADFVRRGDKRGLLAFLLLHTIISSGEHEDGWSSTLHLQVWARALDTVSTATGASATSAATKIFSRLVQRQLITRHRAGRQRKVTVTLLSADGLGGPYTRPVGATEDDLFFKLSHEFWTQHWDSQLSLPAIAMLLVALHEKPGFALPSERVPQWYGWSADSAERGLAELADHSILRVSKQVFKNPVSPSGLSSRNLYTVLPPFDRASVNKAAKVLERRRRRGR